MEANMMQTVVMIALVLIFFGVGMAIRWFYDKKRDWTLPEIIEGVQEAIDNPAVWSHLKAHPEIKDVIGAGVYDLLMKEKPDEDVDSVIDEEGGKEEPEPS